MKARRKPDAPAWQPAVAGDLPTLLPMARVFYRENHLPFSGARFAAQIRRLIREPVRGQVWVVLVAGSPAGYAITCNGFSVEYGGVTAMLDELYIDGAQRGRGLGTATLRFLRREARKAGLVRLFLEVVPGNAGAERLYRRTGYRNTGRTVLALRP